MPGVEQVQVSENVITVLDLNKYNTLNAKNIYKDIEKHIDISTTTYFSYPGRLRNDSKRFSLITSTFI